MFLSHLPSQSTASQRTAVQLRASPPSMECRVGTGVDRICSGLQRVCASFNNLKLFDQSLAAGAYSYFIGARE